MVIPPHEVKLIPTGLCSAFSSKYRIGIRERGSNTNSTLITMTGQIDSNYRGEWFVALYNGNNVPVEITKNIDKVEKCEDFIRTPCSKAVAQFAVEIVPNILIKETAQTDILNIKSDRGTGCLGSSGK